VLKIICMIITLIAQKNVTDSTTEANSKNKNIDIVDWFRRITKKTVRIPTDSTKKGSLGPFYTPILYPGYALVTGYHIGLSNALSFYTHHGEDAKISTISIDNVYSQYNQFINIARSNIWLGKERFNLQGDWRYYKFPTNTFGLGGKTTVKDKNAVDYSQVRFDEIIMTKIARYLSGGIGLNLD
jgi:hypothetical protein